MFDVLSCELNREKNHAFDFEFLCPAMDLYLTPFDCNVNGNQDDILQNLQDSVHIGEHP